MSTAASEWDQKELILVMGDLHIPHRCEDIPEAFKQLLQQKVSQVFCTGNLCMKSTEDFVRSLAYNAHIVKGDLDAGLEFPDQKVIKVGEITFGLTHGHQMVPWGDNAILANHARAMGVDVLVTGHSHVAEIAISEGSSSAPAKTTAGAAAATSSAATASSGSTLLLNPGSMTGAYSPFTTQVHPSFLLLAVQGPSVTVYQYEIQQGQDVTVTRTEWKKSK